MLRVWRPGFGCQPTPASSLELTTRLKPKSLSIMAGKRSQAGYGRLLSDVVLSGQKHRDTEAARLFFLRLLGEHDMTEVIHTDKLWGYGAALRQLPEHVHTARSTVPARHRRHHQQTACLLVAPQLP